MQARKLTVVLMAGVVAFLGVLPLSALGGDEEMKVKFYDSCIVREIAGCQKKAVLLNSSSENLQEYARAETRKAGFLADQKERLIQELLEKQVALKDHSVQVYINSRFREETDNSGSEEALLLQNETAQ